MKCPTGAPVIGGGRRGGHGAELLRLERDRPMGVDHALGIAGGSGGEGDDRRSVRVDAHRTGHGVGVEQTVEGDRINRRRRSRCVHDGPRDVVSGQQLGVGRDVVAVAEPVWGDGERRLGHLDDVGDLLGAVEVHDRDDDGTGVRGSPERDRRLDPVGQLEQNDVSRTDAAVPQRTGEGRARRSTSPMVPCHGRTSEWIANVASPIAASSSATRSPSESSVHHPSAR